jgi:hypothetical protein
MAETTRSCAVVTSRVIQLSPFIPVICFRLRATPAAAYVSANAGLALKSSTPRRRCGKARPLPFAHGFGAQRGTTAAMGIGSQTFSGEPSFRRWIGHQQSLETWGHRKPEAMPLRAGSRARCGKGEGSGREFTRTVLPPGSASEKDHQPNEREGALRGGNGPAEDGSGRRRCCGWRVPSRMSFLNWKIF